MEPHVVHLKKVDSNPLLLAVSFFQSRASLLFQSNVISKLASHCCRSSAYVHKRKRWSISASLGFEPTTFLIHDLTNWRIRPLGHPWPIIIHLYGTNHLDICLVILDSKMNAPFIPRFASMTNLEMEPDSPKFESQQIFRRGPGFFKIFFIGLLQAPGRTMTYRG